MKFEAFELPHGNVVVQQPGAQFVVAFPTIGECERYAAGRNQQLHAALNIESVVPEVWAGGLEESLFGILDRLHGDESLWEAA